MIWIERNNPLFHGLKTNLSGAQLLGDGEFVEWHKEDDTRSLIWSTPLEMRSMLDLAVQVFGRPDDSHKGFLDRTGKRGLNTTAADAFNLAIDLPHEVDFIRLEYDNDIALIWSPTPGTDSLRSQSSFGEASIIFQISDPELAAEAIRLTATKHVGQLASKIVAHVTA